MFLKWQWLFISAGFLKQSRPFTDIETALCVIECKDGVLFKVSFGIRVYTSSVIFSAVKSENLGGFVCQNVAKPQTHKPVTTGGRN